MSEAPFIDVVICTYNRAPLLDRVLAALARQQNAEGVAWSVLVVDNNSTDGTAAVVEAHAGVGGVPGLRIVREPEQGLTRARRRGVLATSAPWVAFVDDDCLLADDWIEAAAAFLRAHPGIGGMGGRVELDWEGTPPGYVHGYGWALAAQDHGTDAKEVGSLAGAGMVIRREALSACGWLDRPLLDDRIGKRLISGGDVELTLRVRSAGYALWYNPACVLRHAVGAERASRPYLVRLIRGLGASQTFADALVWNGSYSEWRRVTRQSVRRRIVETVHALGRAVRRRRLTPALFDVSFAWGRWRGLRQVERMSAPHRNRLLGCAALTEANRAEAV
jgi:glycosyltransferase involved in cell wall biosynthesis